MSERYNMNNLRLLYRFIRLKIYWKHYVNLNIKVLNKSGVVEINLYLSSLLLFFVYFKSNTYLDLSICLPN